MLTHYGGDSLDLDPYRCLFGHYSALSMKSIHSEVSDQTKLESVQFSSVQFRDSMGRRRGHEGLSAEMLFQTSFFFFLREAIVSSSGMEMEASLWRCPSSISSADRGVAHPPRCLEEWLWRASRNALHAGTM